MAWIRIERETMVKMNETIKEEALVGIIGEFNKLDSIVKIRHMRDGVAMFILGLRKDIFLNNEMYDEGSASIYLRKEVYERIESLAAARGFNVGYNNTRSIFWLSVKFIKCSACGKDTNVHERARHEGSKYYCHECETKRKVNEP